MAEAIRLGRMTDTMDEGFVAELNVKVGDKVKVGDSVAEIETDKATLPLESYFEGEVLYIAVKKGDTLPINALVAVVGKKGEDYSALLKEQPEQPAAAKKEETKATTGVQAPAEQQTTAPAEQEHKLQTLAASAADGRIKASPLARSIAREKGLDLSAIAGSGEDGRIIKRDLENLTSASTTVATVSGEEGYSDVRVSQMRKTIAKRLAESKYSAPHFYLTIDVAMDNAIALRQQLNEALPEKISFNDIVLKATAAAIREYPEVNCTWLGEVVRYYKHIHIGMAVAVEEGLVVPVIKFADRKTISAIGAETKALAQKVASKKIQPQEMTGNTFTVSNLGMFGIEEFTAIINPPDSCILAVGAIREEVALQDGQAKAVHKMKLTLSCDHRSVDGAKGAKFLQTLKNILEKPIRILV